MKKAKKQKITIGQVYKLKYNRQKVRVGSYDGIFVYYQYYDQNGVIGLSIWHLRKEDFLKRYKLIK